jgi:hypothetical protein
MSRSIIKQLALALAQVDLANYDAGADELVLDAAVRRYEQDRPRKTAAALTLDGGGAQLPDDYEDGFSDVLSVECPTGKRPPIYVAQEDFYVYPADAGPRLEVVANPGPGCRAEYSVRHTCAYPADGADDAAIAAACTVPPEHFQAVAYWTAALLCQAEAARTSGKVTPTIQADSVDQTKPAANFTKRSEDYFSRYFNELGIDPKRNVAAGTEVSFRLKDSRGLPPLTHPLPVLNPLLGTVGNI